MPSASDFKHHKDGGRPSARLRQRAQHRGAGRTRRHKMWAGVKRNNHPVRHCRRILGCSAIRRARESPHLADRTGHRSCQSTPPGIPDQASDGRSPGSRIFRLPPPSQGSPQWPITASFPPTVAGQQRIRAKTRHRIPFSLLIFEETVNSASLKGAGAGLVNGDALRRIGLATAELQSIVPGVVGSRITSGTQVGTR